MKRLRNILPLLVILGGMLILFYPTISNFLIMRNASRAVNNYDASVEALSQEQYQKVLDAAHAYNEKLAQNDAGETDALASAVNSASTDEEYNSLLNIDGDGMMGYITVPKLKETLPIYHGTSEKVLQSGIGHLEQTSLPLGDRYQTTGNRARQGFGHAHHLHTVCGQHAPAAGARSSHPIHATAAG